MIYKLRRYLTCQPLKKTSYRSLSCKKFQKRQNDRKGSYSLAHCWIEVTRPKKAQIFWTFPNKFSKNNVFWSCAIFSKVRLNASISNLLVISYFMKFYVDQTFWVERHLGVVLKVLLVVGSKKNCKTCRLYNRNIAL